MLATDEGGRFRFEPSVIEVGPGQRVSLKVSNTGLSAHDLVISRVNVETGQLNPGEEKVVTFTAPSQPGEYEFICSVPGHAQLGMTGKLIVKR